MSSVVHFKFKSSTLYDSVSFDGAFITVGELKVLIAEKKSLTKDATAELVLSDPRTQVTYDEDTAVVPKSSSVLVKRVPNLPNAPLVPQEKKGSRAQNAATPASGAAEEPVLASASATENGRDDFGEDLFAEQRSEDAALAKMLQQTGQQWETEVRQSNARGRGRGRGRMDFGGRSSQGRGRGHDAAPIVLPKGYICYRCGKQGHHITDCPTNDDPDFQRKRPAIGVPSVMLQIKEGGGLLLPDGTMGSLQANEDAFRKEVGLMPPPQQQGESTAQPSDSNAIVLAGDAGPKLAGDLQMPDTLLLPPPAGLLANGGLPLPDIPLSGLTTHASGGPMSREEFERFRQLERLQEKLRKDDRRRKSSSRSRSRSPLRRRRDYRERDSPRRRESPRRSYRTRRHYSRERSLSRDRRSHYDKRRFSPIFDRRRSRSPVRSFARRPSPVRRRPSPIATHRRQAPLSPATKVSSPLRWQPDNDPHKMAAKEGEEEKDVFGDSFEEDEPLPVGNKVLEATKSSASPKFSEPQLIGAPLGGLFSDSLDFRGSVKPKKGTGLGISARLKPAESIRQQVERATEARQEPGSDTEAARGPKSSSPPLSNANAENVEATIRKDGPLPKTFTIPFDHGKQSKSKSSRERKSKQKRKDASPDVASPAREDEQGAKKQRKTDVSPEGQHSIETVPSHEAGQRDRTRAQPDVREESVGPIKIKEKIDSLERYRQESLDANEVDEGHTIKADRPKKEKEKHKEKKRHKDDSRSKKKHKEKDRDRERHKEKKSKSRQRDKEE